MITIQTEFPMLDELLSTEPALPNVPRVVALVANEASRAEPDLRKLCQLIGSDAGLAARTLQMANSSKFRFSEQIGNVSEAIAVLGPKYLHSIAQGAATADAFRPVPGIQLQTFWRYSVNTAKVARSLAGMLRLNSSTAFTAGLVHAIGELVILGGVSPSRTAAINDTAAPLSLRRARAEQRDLGYCYADVVAALARRWHWPDFLVDALAHQHEPFEEGSYEPLAGVLHLAAWRASTREAGLSGNALTVTFPGEVGVPLGLDIDMVLQQDPIDWNSRGTAASWR